MTSIEQQIKASVANGLTKPAIEALLGRSLTFDETQLYRKVKAIYDLQLRKRRSERKYEHLSGTDAKRKFDEKKSSIDKILDEANENIDWERRERASKSLSSFIREYLMDTLFESEPSDNMNRAIAEMFRCLSDSRPYNIELPRGSGKTTVSEAMILYLIAYGLRKFCVIVSSNARQAQNILKDIYRVISEKDTAFAQDFPDICVPFISCNGFTRRIQKYGGRVIEMEKNVTSIILPRIFRNGEEVPTSGSVITARGITAGLRGMKVGKLRPDLCLLDDIQTAESASSQEQVAKLIDLVKKDVMNLTAKGKLSVLMTSTPICPEDLCEAIENDVNWKTTKFPAIIKYPTDMQKKGDNGLWGQYFKMYDNESVTDTPHEDSLAFYKEHFEEMNDGAEIFASRYKESDGHISGLQALLERRHLIGEDAFQAEMQMNPKALQFALPITPKIVASRISNLNELEVPQEGVQYICAASDLNLSKYITTVIMVFMQDQTAHVIWHKFRKSSIPINIPEQDYYVRVYNLLGEHGKELKKIADEHGFKIQGWSIDASGVPYRAVLEFAKNSTRICGISAAAFLGRASHRYRSFIRSRLKEEVNRTVLCGDEEERKKIGSGHKYLYFDSDLYHEQTQKGFLQEVGNIGSISWYKGGNHSEWAIQVCNEKLMLKRARQDGTVEYTWKDIGEDHDVLDAVGQCLATHASQGFSTGDSGRRSLAVARQKFHKRKIRVV